MKLSMVVDFKILKRNENNVFVPMNNKEAAFVSIGGFSFEVENHSVPFDWDNFYGTENENIFSFITGKGFAVSDYELSKCYDEMYEDFPFKREDISAKFLASTHHIEEFYVDFMAGEKEVGLGHFADNADIDAQYKIEIIDMRFHDMDHLGEYYKVDQEVLNRFNRGIYKESKKVKDENLDTLIHQANGLKDNNLTMGKDIEDRERD